MSRFVVEVTANLPYPRSHAYHVSASGFGTAANRAVRKFRKEEKVRGKRIAVIKLKVTRLIA